LLQLPLQDDCPVGHGVVHAPFVQVAPAAQALPHLPQFFTSVCVLEQDPLQFICGAVQVVAHIPLLHA
jgi:hypothetical protein